ncbi:hypothetical protein [Chitinophaga sp. sic0106]|uniref:hypothetical protein n=1 Tax=Chitinophaga sp. sic0106 TaxID=2854785 RepID=UPI001C46F990|nr:hypothetical protein [Chitinophaga sp. sic0106]MBV7529890.1 hypothetical protein [Chitinophaga sp. sic0106]
MTKDITPVISAVLPRIQELEQDITANNNFSAASIKDDSIVSLFPLLLNQTAITLSGLEFSNPNDNTLQVTATATLFTQQIKITAVFVMDEANKLSMTMNPYVDIDLPLAILYSSGVVPGGSSEDYIPPVGISGISFVFDSAASAFTLKGQGDKWTFLGYTGLYVGSPALTLVNTYQNESQQFYWNVSGTLKSDSANVNIPVSIQLPIGILGWRFSLGPASLVNGLGIIDALTGVDLTSILPQGFTDRLSEIEISSFSAGFNPKTNTLYETQLFVTTTADWVIIQDKLKLAEGITLVLNGQREAENKPLSYSGYLQGTAALNYGNPEEEVKASANIPIPIGEGEWTITLQNDTLPLGIGKLAILIPGMNSFLPPGVYDKLNDIILDYLTIRFKFDNGFSFTNISFAIYSNAAWQLPGLQQAIYLDKGFKMQLDVPFPVTTATMTGELSGIIQIAGGQVTIPIKLSKSPTDTDWSLLVTSEKIPIPSLSTLSGFMGLSVLESASPSGLMGIGNFAIYNLKLVWIFGAASKLQFFGLTVKSTPGTPAWNLVPGYFVLSDLFISFAIENKTVSDKDISGNIGTTVTWILNPETKSKLVLYMLASKTSSASPWKFNGSLTEDLILKDLLMALKTPQSVIDLLPSLTVTKFDLSIEPATGSFSIAMTIATVETWTILSIGSLNINMDNIGFSVQKYDTNLNLAASGNFTLVSAKKEATVTLTAQYSKSSWNFNGTYDNSTVGAITINEILEEYIPGIDGTSIPKLSITKILVAIEKGTTDTNTAYNTFQYIIAGELSAPDLRNLLIKAKMNIMCDSRNTTSPYDGTEISGDVTFGGLSFSAVGTYKGNKFSEYKYILTFKNIEAIAAVTPVNNTTVFTFTLKNTDPTKQLTLGDVIAAMIEAATGDVVVIPAPWDFILNIGINDFSLEYILNNDTQQKTVSLLWDTNINLGFVNIEQISLSYQPEENGQNGPVMFAITKGTFLGMPIDKVPPQDKPDWDLRDPAKAPAVPGFGDSEFKLEFLGIGNQVAIKSKATPATVVQAIDNMSKAFDLSNTDKLPVSLKFDKNYGVLFGVQFILVKYIRIAAVFYDPELYGLSIDVKDGQFKNLSFEVLYKKINDNVGVFQINLTLPDFVRQQQFGVVAVTLPSLTLSVYTNGDFVIDMGFPKNADFSRSFGLEFSIFTGAGGFYFGKLSSETATMLKSSKGQFNPVIIFGIGIRAGLGKSVDKGVLKAELSLTIQVILEGILAWFELNPTQDQLVPSGKNEVLYYKLSAQAALVGRIYGEIDFVIISASLDVVARIMAQLTLEAYRQTIITFSAEVFASITVRINLGLFKISISCSFRATISDAFTIGKNDPSAPWGTLPQADNSAYFTPLDAPVNFTIPEMIWSAALDYPTEQLNLLFIPQLSLKYDADATSRKQAVAASLLYVQHLTDSADSSNFTILSRAFLAWVFNAYFAGKGISGGKILEQEVTIDDLNAIAAYFNQPEIASGAIDAFKTTDLYDYFLAKAFKGVSITTQEASAANISQDTVVEVAYFPIIPMLAMQVNKGPALEFSDYNTCSPDYLQHIRDYFREMQVQFQHQQQEKLIRESQSLTMAEFLFTDYFVMMAKSAFQDIINSFKEMAITTRKNDSLQSVANRYHSYGVTPTSLAHDNRHQPLRAAAKIHIPGFSYQLKDGETVEMLSAKFQVSNSLQANEQGILYIPSFTYSLPVTETHTLQSLAGKFNSDTASLAAINITQESIFNEGTRLIHAFVATKKVQQILDELQQDASHQLSNLGGTVSRFFLSGLRIPKTVSSDERIGLYEGSGQQFNLVGNIEGQQVALLVTKGNPAWLKLGLSDQLTFTFNKAMSDAADQLLSATYVPAITLDDQGAVKRYKLQPRTFAISTTFKWQDPNLQEVKTTAGETFIRTFPAQLQQYLNSYDNIPYQLQVQSATTAFTQTVASNTPVMSWSSFVTVSIRRVPDAATPGSYVDKVYVVEGCSEADGQLLQQLITSSQVITSLDVLYADNTTKPNEGKQVNGLISIGIKNYKTFLLQTNFSTISNPGSSANATASGNPNLLGMEAMTFLTYLWECSIVRSGGYYLHYATSTGSGLPGFIFDEDGIGSIRILVTYHVPIDNASGGYLLPPYANSAVMQQPLTDTDTLLATITLSAQQQQNFNPVLQQIQATILPGTSMFKGSRTNPQTMLSATMAGSANQQISELFQLMEYSITAKPGVYKTSHYALPAGPLDTSDNPQVSITRLPTPKQDQVWNYSAVLPVYPFVDNGSNPSTDPYGANGKTADVYFNFLDVFGNTLTAEGDSGITQSVTPGYTDPVVGIDQWINVSRIYDISQDAVSGKPTLTITLHFDSSRYKNATDPVTLARQDLKRYQEIYWQLTQEGVTATIACTIGALETPGTPALQKLQTYVAEIITFLKGITPIVTDEPITAVLLYGIDTKQLNANLIFQLSVTMTISRTKFIDPQFVAETAISTATTTIPPDLYHGNTASQTALSKFAAALELALPVMKVAAGAGHKEDIDKEIWLARFATDTAAGISFSVNNTFSSFGIRPLSTSLISRPDDTHTRPVPVRTYTSGQYLGTAPAEGKAYSGVDIELLARTFIASMDNFLSAQNSTQAWQVAQSGTCNHFPAPFESLEKAKRSISHTVANTQLTNILQGVDLDRIGSAQNAMEQQMLVLMDNMYKTDAVVQTAVTVSQGFATSTASLYGQLVFADEVAPNHAYSFTPVKVSLTKGKQDLNSLFSVRQEAPGAGQDIDLTDQFKGGLNLQITGLEHNFGTPINGYIPSSWLTFAIPIVLEGKDNTPLIHADIPVPLKAYPTAPALVTQNATPTPPDDGDGADLESALLWDYKFSYNYIIARQDLIYLNILLNTADQSQRDGFTADPLDLFEALVQFNTCHEAMMDDIAKGDANSIVALQSFAWIVQQISNAWPLWFPTKAKAIAANTKILNFTISEAAEDKTGNLLITISAVDQAPGLITMPLIAIPGFNTIKRELVNNKQTYSFEEPTTSSPAPLLFSERKKFSEREIIIRGNNVLVDENGWAGVAVHRNEELAGQPANTDFRYITPYIRFASICYPNLLNDVAINMADYSDFSSGKLKLPVILQNFFTALFAADPERKVTLQLQAGYAYKLQNNTAAVQLGPTLPVVLTIPHPVTGNTIGTLTAPFAEAILHWFTQQSVVGVAGSGKLAFIITLFAANSGDMHHPVLTLEGVYLPTNIIDFS